MIRTLRATLVLTFLVGSPFLGLASEPAQPAPHVAPADPAHASTPEAHGSHAEAAHHGPDVKLFGHPLGTWGQFGLKLFNFAIFAGLLFVLLKGALSSAFKARAQEIRDLLNQSERDRAEAEAQLRDLETRMAHLQQELDALMARTEAEAESERARILEAARAEADQILAQAQQDIAHHHRVAEQELRALVAHLAIEGAEARLRDRVQGDVATRVLDRAIHQVGGTL